MIERMEENIFPFIASSFPVVKVLSYTFNIFSSNFVGAAPDFFIWILRLKESNNSTRLKKIKNNVTAALPLIKGNIIIKLIMIKLCGF